MKFEYNGIIYDINVIRKNNKNTYIRVKDNGIYITTNYFVTNRQIEKLVKDNEKSIINMIKRLEKRVSKNEDFYLFGKKFDIVYGDCFKDIDIDNDKIFVRDNKSLVKFLNKKIESVFKEHLDYWYNLFEEDIPSPNLKIRKMKTRWGVCNTRNKNVTLNYDLYRLEIRCLDYVIVHELSHFIFPNHSSSFWKLVSKYCPNYKEIRKEMRD